MLEIKNKMIDFLRRETQDRGFYRVIFGLSGGLDSSIVALLCKEAFDDKAKAILMPSSKSSEINFNDALYLADFLNLPYEILPLNAYENIFSTYGNMDKIRYGNFCSRIRMMLLYDLSTKDQALVIGTSNKTERLLGYGTIFGDLAYAINPIGDMFKTDLFEFAKFIGIPQRIIDKQPSADLYEGQTDEEDLGYSYSEIDQFLKEAMQIDHFKNFDLISQKISQNYSSDFKENLLKRIQRNQFKLQQPNILNLNLTH